MAKMLYVFKLRQNISMDGDLVLARMELESFVNDVHEITGVDQFLRQHNIFAVFEGLSSLTSHLRAGEVKAYYGETSLTAVPTLVRRVSFFQHLYGVVDDTPENEALLETYQQGVVSLHYQRFEDKLILQAVPHYALIEYSDVVTKASLNPADVRKNLDSLLDALLSRTVDVKASGMAEKALSAMSTTSHLSHDIHYYKAKFFPRMARSLLNICANHFSNGQICRAIDNFAGSGTTLLEAALLGIECVGVDIDPLSVLISRMKLQMMEVDSALLQSEIEGVLKRISNASVFDLPLFHRLQEDYDSIDFPDWFLKNRKVTPEVVAMLQQEVVQLKSVIHDADPQVQDILRVILSDAISRRIRMRFLGTGVGRFSLTLSKTSLVDIFTRSLKLYAKVAVVVDWLCETLHVTFAPTHVVKQDARDLNGEWGSFNILVTSPPYLPASSGRESYTRARMPSLVALDMLSVVEGSALENHIIGAMVEATVDCDLLTDRERVTVDWLLSDDLRKIKAIPTAKYFLDMRTSFNEMYRILNPGGMAVIVSGKQSTFYEFKTREVLHTVPSAEFLADEAQSAGFEVLALHDIQLQKANANARPRSLDDYYETLIFLKKPP